MSLESSSSVYKVLMTKLGAKAQTSLEHVKKACDLIVVSRGQMNYSTAAKVATENFGGPKVQTVQNNKGLKRYIAARIAEYQNDKKAQKLPYTKKKSHTADRYPVDNLDMRTKTYIDSLRSRNAFLEARYQELRKGLEAQTRANPIDYGKAIGLGPASDGALQLEYKANDTEQLHKIREGVHTLLNLDEHISTIKVEERDHMKRVTHKRPAGDRVLIGPSVYVALEQFLKETEDA